MYVCMCVCPTGISQQQKIDAALSCVCVYLPVIAVASTLCDDVGDYQPASQPASLISHPLETATYWLGFSAPARYLTVLLTSASRSIPFLLIPSPFKG